MKVQDGPVLLVSFVTQVIASREYPFLFWSALPDVALFAPPRLNIFVHPRSTETFANWPQESGPWGFYLPSLVEQQSGGEF